MDANHYKMMREKIDAEYRANIEALERVMALDKSLFPQQAADVLSPLTSQKSPPQQAATKSIEELLGDDPRPPAQPQRGAVQKGELTAAIESIFPDLPDKFTVHTVTDAIKSKNIIQIIKDSSIRQAIGRLVETKKIVVYRQGQGRAPSVYRLPTSGNALDDLGFSIDDI